MVRHSRGIRTWPRGRQPVAIYDLGDQRAVYQGFVAAKQIRHQEMEITGSKQTAAGVQAISPVGTKKDIRLAHS